MNIILMLALNNHSSNGMFIPFLVNVLNLYQRFSDVFRGCKMGSMVRNRLINGILSNEIFNNCFIVTKFLREVI